MYQKDNSLEDRQKPSDYSVDKNGHGNYGPSEERPVIVLGLIVWVVQDDETLDNRACKDAAHSECGDPRK